MRQDQFKDKQYFSQHIGYLESFRPRAMKKLNEGVDEIHRKRLLYSLLDRTFDALISKYTAGEDLGSLAHYNQLLIEDVENYLESGGELAPDAILSQYVRCIWLLSFCYFFNAPKEDIEFIVSHIPFVGKDRLIDFLVKASLPDYQVNASKLAFPDIYQPLMDSLGLLHEPESYRHKIQQFLDGYYPGLKKHDVTWHDSHKEQDPEYCFHFGYWIFEAAALMVFTRCDDSPFREHPFYPADLADWKKAQEWK